MIDRIERDAVKKLGIFLVIHMDPVETKDEQVLAVQNTSGRDRWKRWIQVASIHDFRMVEREGADQSDL